MTAKTFHPRELDASGLREAADSSQQQSALLDYLLPCSSVHECDMPQAILPLGGNAFEAEPKVLPQVKLIHGVLEVCSSLVSYAHQVSTMLATYILGSHLVLQVPGSTRDLD
jgi:hypothetical protein